MPLRILKPITISVTRKPYNVRVINVVSGCYAVLPLELSVNLPPLVNDFPEIDICDNDADIFDLEYAYNNPN